MTDQITSLTENRDNQNLVATSVINKVKTQVSTTLDQNLQSTPNTLLKKQEQSPNKSNIVRVAINGFGRIGRQFFKIAFDNPNIQVVAINDLGDINNLVYLLKYDTVYGPYNKKIEVLNNNLLVEGEEVKFLSNPKPEELPWKDLNIDIVIESTGAFTTTEKASAHLKGGAKRVVISAPAKDEQTPTSTPNLNEDATVNAKITSNGSCTTNAATPVAAIMDETVGIEAALLNTVHGYTSTQALVDGTSTKDYRRGRAAAQNMIPTSSGSAISVEKAIPQMKGLMDAMAIRVPVPSGSILDFTFISKKPTSVEEVNKILKEYSEKENWKDILEITEVPLVSSDILKNPHGSIVDLDLTRVINGRLVKILAWYDNEWGYVNMLLKHVLTVANFL